MIDGQLVMVSTLKVGDVLVWYDELLIVLSCDRTGEFQPFDVEVHTTPKDYPPGFTCFRWFSEALCVVL